MAKMSKAQLERAKKKQSEYWHERFIQLQEAELKKSDDYAKELEKAFKRTQAYVTADVEAWYAKYANDNNLTLAEARRQLSLKELRDYQMTVEEYMEKGRQLETHPEFADELQKASAKVHMTRLQAIKNQINMRLEALYGGIAKGIRERLSDVLHRIFGHSLFEIDKGTGIGVSTMGMSTEEAEKLLLSPWTPDGRNFSDRIWTDKAKLMKALETDLTTCLMRGENPSTLIDKFAKEFDVSRYQAGRLLHTETAYFNSLGTLEAYKKRGVQEYQIEATLDKRTSEICQDMDGQHFKVDEYEVGITAPPFHPNCRTCTVPYFDDEFTEGEKRASRNSEGKTETTVPADMTYKEWEKKYLTSENERSTKSTDEHDFSLTFDPKSNEFIERISNLEDDENVVHSMVQQSQAILAHRGSTKYEDLTYIYPDGSFKSQTKYNYESSVMPTSEMVQKLSQFPDDSVISIHNHPESSCPSLSDLGASYTRKYKYGIVIGHDGTIFKYKSNIEIPSEESTNPIDIAKRNALNLKLSRIDDCVNSNLEDKKTELANLLKELYNEGIEIEVL